MGTRTRAGAEERRALVRSLYEQGLGKEEIAERLGINGRNVLGHLTALGFEQPFASQRPPPRPPKLRADPAVGDPVRRAHARGARAVIHEGSVEPGEAELIFACALHPSETVYWVPLPR